MAITKINIDKGSAPVLVQEVSRVLRKTWENYFKEVSKENVKFGYIFSFLTEPKLYSPDITGGRTNNRSFCLQLDLLIVKLRRECIFLFIRIQKRTGSAPEHSEFNMLSGDWV